MLAKVTNMENNINNFSNFIVTTDEETKNKFLESGLSLISQNENAYTFVNDPKKIMKFSDNNLKFSFTNKLTI